MQDTHVHAQYHTFLIKHINVNNIIKLHWKFIKYDFFKPITKMHDFFIADPSIHVNFTPKRYIYLYIPHDSYPITHNFFRSDWWNRQWMNLQRIDKIQAQHIISKMSDFFVINHANTLLFHNKSAKLAIFFCWLD